MQQVPTLFQTGDGTCCPYSLQPLVRLHAVSTAQAAVHASVLRPGAKMTLDLDASNNETVAARTLLSLSSACTLGQVTGTEKDVLVRHGMRMLFYRLALWLPLLLE